MYRVISCLSVEHDYRLVVLAVLVCLATALTTFKLYAIARHYHDHRRLGWAALSGVCAAILGVLEHLPESITRSVTALLRGKCV